jgi:hypothetical protein
MFVVKGGTIEVLLAANETGPIEHGAITFDAVRSAARFSLERFLRGCSRLFRPFLAIGILLMVVYALSGAAYAAFVVYGYRAAGDRFWFVGWAFIVTLATIGLVIWITLVNLMYLLLQIVVAADGVSVIDAGRAIARLARARFRLLGGVFLVMLILVIGATFASALAWSGVGLIAFVPLVGLAVFPLQIAALILRGLVFEYIGLTGLGAYLALYRSKNS